MTYDVLKARTLQAKKDSEKLRLAGIKSTIVSYIYTELLECIEHQKFCMPRRITTVQATLFTVKVEGTHVYISTHYRYNAQHIKCFKCINRENAKDMLEVIRSAVSQLGLGFAPHKFEKEVVQIFIELGESMI